MKRFLFTLAVLALPAMAKGPQKMNRKPAVKSTKKVRGPASVAAKPAEVVEAPVETQVFDESSSFERMLSQRQDLERQIASMNVSARVIAVRREVGLSREESDSAAQDIILNAGTDAGINEGMILTVERRIPILDPYRDNQQSELQVHFALLKVISAQNNISVARLEKIQPIKVGIGVGTRAVLIGDYVGLGGQLR